LAPSSGRLDLSCQPARPLARRREPAHLLADRPRSIG